METRTCDPGIARWLPSLLFWAGLALFAFGFVSNAMWRAVSLGPSQLVWLLLIAAALAGLFKWLGAKWRGHCAFATMLLVVGLAGLLGFAGVRQVLTVALIGLAALGIGSALVPAQWPARLPLALVAGVALIVGVDGWLLPFRMHFRAVYLVIFLALIVWRYRSIVVLLRPVVANWQAAVDSAPRSAALTLVVLFAASAWAWLPTTMYDDLAYHLALPSQLAALGHYRMDVAGNVWALAPWAGDVLQAIVQIVAGTEARGAVDMLWFGLSCALMWQLCQTLSLSVRLRWLAVALFACLPLTMKLLHSMQTEGPTVTVMLALAYLIVAQPSDERRALTLIGVLFGLLIGLKVSNVWFAGPLGLWWLCRNRRVPGWRGLPLALLLGVLVAGSSYVYAWVLTGNPVLPLFNGFFHSPWYPLANFHDARWDTGFGWSLIWHLVFQPGRFVESGSIGPVVLVALAGCFFVTLVGNRARGLAVVGLACLLLPLSMTQYYRYAYPALALLIPAMLCGVPVTAGGVRQARGMWMALWALVAISVVFAGSAGWQVKTGALALRVVSGKAAVVTRYRPMRQVLNKIGRRDGGAARVLILTPDKPFAAQMAGRAFVVNWYDPTLAELAHKAQADKSGAGWRALFARTGANVLVTDQRPLPENLAHAMSTLQGKKLFVEHGLTAWRLPATVSAEHDLNAQRNRARQVYRWFGFGHGRGMGQVEP